jgi:hypothetical protein
MHKFLKNLTPWQDSNPRSSVPLTTPRHQGCGTKHCQTFLPLKRNASEKNEVKVFGQIKLDSVWQPVQVPCTVAGFFLVRFTKMAKNIPNDKKSTTEP